MQRFPVYLFDVDGTLLDSWEDISGALLEVFRSTPRAPVDPAYLRRFTGSHLLDTFQDLLPGLPPEQYDEMIRHYRQVYPARKHRNTRVFPGVREGLAALNGRKATATTKYTVTCRAVLEAFDLIGYFDHVQGTDGFPHKPAPDVIHIALAALGASPEDCLLVGDSPADMEAGRRAGVRTCAVRYGYGDLSELERWQPDYWVSDLRELAV
jgi:phosphoglycolate phosphatase